MIRTKSENYLLTLFGSATLQGAIEMAAELARRELRDQRDRVPVDVFRIARGKAVRVSNDLIGGACEEGLLIPEGDGYLVRLRKNSTESRRRFSLAHELGHTLFYKDSGAGLRHQVGVLNTVERSAEERICNLYASALLMPAEHLKARLKDLPFGQPSRLLDALEGTAREFRVSVQALFRRLRTVEIVAPEYLVLALTSRPNPAKGGESALRVDDFVTLGAGTGVCIWRNRSAATVGLREAVSLYDKWKEVSRRSATKGCFALDRRHALLRASNRNTIDCEETIFASRVIDGRWISGALRARTSSRLYAWTAGTEPAAYVVSALALDSISGKPLH